MKSVNKIVLKRKWLTDTKAADWKPFFIQFLAERAAMMAFILSELPIFPITTMV